MDTIVLEAKTRDMSKKLNHLRAESRLPAAYYGKGITNLHVDLDYQEFRRAYVKGGQNTVIDLKLDGKLLKALVHELQFDPLTDMFTHIDFIAVDMNKEVSTSIPLIFVGTSPAVKDLGGTLMESRNEINVTCLARDLIHEIEVDLTMLEDFHSVIHISDLSVPETVTIDDDMGLSVATVAAPKSQEEIDAEEAADAAASAEAMDAVKDEGDEEAKEGGEGEEGGEDKKEEE